MENNIHKNIAEKLDQLDSLPVHYHPDLNSKWSLLEEALNKPNDKTGFYWKWFSVAASLIILFSMGTLMFFKHQQPEFTIAKKQNHLKGTEQFSGAAVEKIKNAGSRNEIKPLERKSILSVIKNIKAQTDTAQKQVVVSITPSKLDTINSPAPGASPPVWSEARMKKKKPRYVQFDFNDPVPKEYPGGEQKNTAQLFHITINKSSVTEQSADPNSNPAAQIKVRYSF